MEDTERSEAILFKQLLNTEQIPIEVPCFGERIRLGRTRMALYQKRIAIMGCGDHLPSNIKMQNGTEEKSVDSLGRRVIWQLNSKVGRKQTAPQDVILFRTGREG